MDPPDDDIEFDFFEDEPQTTEAAQPSRVRLPRRSSGGGRGRRPAGPPHGLTPFLRLLAAVAIVIALLVIFGLLLQSCASTSKHRSNYGRRREDRSHSLPTGRAALRETPGTRSPTQPALASPRRTVERLGRAEPARLPLGGAPEHDQALQLRVLGTRATDALQTTWLQVVGQRRCSPSRRLLASDVVR
jgi:hypothetical protein